MNKIGAEVGKHSDLAEVCNTSTKKERQSLQCATSIALFSMKNINTLHCVIALLSNCEFTSAKLCFPISE